MDQHQVAFVSEQREQRGLAIGLASIPASNFEASFAISRRAFSAAARQAVRRKRIIW
jgi:hypothetical protein